jgi:amphi-Trp domain-containing protein
MADVEIKRKIRISRKEAGERLIDLGKALTEAPEAKLDLDGDSIKFTVADDVDWEFELEVDGNKVELEIELKWSQAPVAEPARTPTPTPVAKRARKSRRGDDG